MTPMLRAPPSRAARATSPIMDTRPPPDTNVQSRFAIAPPTSAARSRYRWGTGLEAQYTQTAFAAAASFAFTSYISQHRPVAQHPPAHSISTHALDASVRPPRLQEEIPV